MTPESVTARLEAALSDEVLSAIDDTIDMTYSINKAEVKRILVAHLAPILAERTCATCRHWLPADRAKNFRAQCNMGVSGATAEKASHHPYPITRRDFGCTLHEPLPGLSHGDEG